MAVIPMPESTGTPREGLPQSYRKHHERIKQLRLSRRWSVEKLAQETEIGGSKAKSISSSYIYLIEAGGKIPDENIAKALARALGDDERLYLAWLRAMKPKNLQDALVAAAEYEAIAKDANVEMKVADSDQIIFRNQSGQREFAHPDSSSRPQPTADESTFLPSIPVYTEGFDPSSRNPEMIDQVVLKRALLPADRRLVKPFGYRLSSDGVKRVRNTLQEGDTVVITQDPGSIEPDEIYAVRHGERILLTKVLEKGNTLLLLSDEGSAQIEVAPIPRQGGIRALLVGRVVIAIRPWQYAVVSLRK